MDARALARIACIALAWAAQPASAQTCHTDPRLPIPRLSLRRPPAGNTAIDPALGCPIRRVSDRTRLGDRGTHVYSQLQAFSVDNEFLLLIENDRYVVRRLSDLSLVSGLDTSSWNAPRWHPVRPHVIVHFDSNADNVLRLQFTDIDSRTTTDQFVFPAPYERIFVNQSFDEVSRDGRWVAGIASRADGRTTIFALDMIALQLGAQLPIDDLYRNPCRPDPRWGNVWPDWVAVSPLGNYLVIQWVRDGTEMCSGLETYDLRTGTFVGRVNDGHPHGDLGVGVDGVTEYFFTMEISPPPPHNNNPAVVTFALPGTPTTSPHNLILVDTPWGTGQHISCRGPNGMAVLTNGSLPGAWEPMEDEIVIVRTDGSVQRLVHHRSTACGYWVQPRASISRDGRYVVFSSDWGRETGQSGCAGSSLGRGEVYVVDTFTSPCTTRGLMAEPAEVSVSGPTHQSLSVIAGAVAAGDVYLILGSLAGTTPGIALSNATLPLNLDDYFLLTLNAPSGALLQNGAGIVAGDGSAYARFQLPPGLGPQFIGTRVHHACIVINQTGISFASNAVLLTLAQ